MCYDLLPVIKVAPQLYVAHLLCLRSGAIPFPTQQHFLPNPISHPTENPIQSDLPPYPFSWHKVAFFRSVHDAAKNSDLFTACACACPFAYQYPGK